MKGRKLIRKNVPKDVLSEYNKFCLPLIEGDILYNTNTLNKWGELLLVAIKTTIVMEETSTYTLLLLGLKKEGDSITFNGNRIDLTPQKVFSTPFLVVVGHCDHYLSLDVNNYRINKGLFTICKTMGPRRYYKREYGKPRNSKYGEDGELVVKQLNKNKQNETGNQN